jgi:hypothetical protein
MFSNTQFANALAGNAFHNSFNASLAREVAHFLKDSGLLAAGFEYITLGGMGFAEHGDPQEVPGFPNIPPQNITRNATGHLQVDAARFPGPGSTAACLAGGDELAACLRANNYSSAEACGCRDGNAGMRNLTSYLRSLGFKFGKSGHLTRNLLFTVAVMYIRVLVTARRHLHCRWHQCVRWCARHFRRVRAAGCGPLH